MKRLLALVILITPASLSAADLQTHKDLPYADSEDSHQKLDVYAPADARNCPVVVWIHGGGWRQGDKGPVQRKPQAFADKGCLFVSINYRLVPQATIKEMTGDVAKAIRWVHDHAREFGGDGNSLFVMGHSAGAHLAALVCTDDRYLKAEGLPLSVVKGCVPIDVSVYDVVKRREETPTVTGIVVDNFGKTADEQRDLSPAGHVAKGKNIPPFLILHVADRAETKGQSQSFAQVLRDAGISATVVAAEGKTHNTINADLGRPEDKATQAVFDFIARPSK